MQTYIEKYIMDDIFKTLKSHKSKYDIDDKLFEKICKMRIKTYMKQINFKNVKIDKKYSSLSIKKKKNICKCRIWSTVMVYNVVILLKKIIYVKHIIIC